MNQLFNLHDTTYLFQHNWYWLLAAFVIGCIVGFRYNTWHK